MRERKDYDDGLDYEDLVKAHKDEKRREKESRQSRLNTAMHLIGGSIGRIFATAMVVFAISTLIAVFTTRLPNTKGVIEFKISGTGIEDQAMAVVPGTEQTISTSITNESAQEIYMFVRLECGTYGDGESIYSFTPEADSGWSVIEGVGKDGQIVLAYTEGGVLKSVDAMDTVDFAGILKCVVPVKDFMELADNDFAVDFKGFGISTDENPDPKSAYELSLKDR